MRDLKGRYIAPAISAFPPSMVVKAGVKICHLSESEPLVRRTGVGEVP